MVSMAWWTYWASLFEAEIGRIQSAIFAVNSLNDDKIDEAAKSFLADLRERQKEQPTEGRTAKYSIWCACERFKIRPPDVTADTWEDLSVIAQSDLIAFDQIRAYEEAMLHANDFIDK